MMITLLKHADRVKIASVWAQLVNVIAPIMTGGERDCLETDHFYPFYHASCYGRGTVLQLAIDSPKHETSGHGSITDVEAVAVWNEEAEEVTVFAVNRNLEEDLPLTMDLRSFEGYELIGKTELVSDDLQTVNSCSRRESTPSSGRRCQSRKAASWRPC
ncbi:MAG: alpha-L-arabinofuranosidase C-terminal domain-containing protein [Waltera sp.]